MRVKARFYVILIMLILVICIVCLFTMPVFNAAYIQIEGTDRNVDSIINNVSSISRDKSIFLADRSDIKAFVEKDPYLIFKGLSYRLPSTIKIKVEERIPRYYVEHLNNYLYSTADGIIINSQREKNDENTPIVKGYKVNSFAIGEKINVSDSYQVQVVDQLFTKFVETGFDKIISEVDVSDVLHIKIKTLSGYDINFGSAEQIERKLEWLFAIINQVDSIEKKSCVIDVSSWENPTYKIIK